MNEYSHPSIKNLYYEMKSLEMVNMRDVAFGTSNYDNFSHISTLIKHAKFHNINLIACFRFMINHDNDKIVLLPLAHFMTITFSMHR